MMRPYCHVPAMALGGRGANLIETNEQGDERWARAHAGLPEDYHHSVLHTVDVTLMSEDAAFVTVDCGRYNTSDEEYARFWASYVAANTLDGWKITTWIGHESGRTPETVRK